MIDVLIKSRIPAIRTGRQRDTDAARARGSEKNGMRLAEKQAQVRNKNRDGHLEVATETQGLGARVLPRG